MAKKSKLTIWSNYFLVGRVPESILKSGPKFLESYQSGSKTGKFNKSSENVKHV